MIIQPSMSGTKGLDAAGVAGEAGAAGALLRERLAVARARWPAVKLTDAAFFEHVARHAPPDPVVLQALHLEDLFFACACAKADPAALAVLEASILSQVPRWIARFEGVPADDVQQELRQKLLLGASAHLLAYQGKGALARWIRVAATRAAIDVQRRQRPVADDPIEQLFAGPDPEIDFVKLRDREAVRSVLHDAMRALPAREATLLRLHHIEGVSLERLGELERVHRATIARWLADARALVLDQVRKLLRERLRLSEEEGDSLLRLLRSRLDLSIRSAFGTQP